MGPTQPKRAVYLGTNSPRGDDGIYRVTGMAGSRRVPGGVDEINVSNIAVAGTVGSPVVIVSSASTGNAAYRTTNFTSGSAPTFGSTPRPVPGGNDATASSTVVGISPDGGTAFALSNSAFVFNTEDPPEAIGYTPSGNGSFSRSTDGGRSYAQVSLLNNTGAFTDTGMAYQLAQPAQLEGTDPFTPAVAAVAAVAAVPGATIEGFAVSPDFDASGHMIAAASGSRSDVTLYSDNGGARWMVVNTGEFKGSVAFAYSPSFATDNTIYSADMNTQRLLRSSNSGLSWTLRSSVACGGSTISSIAAADANTVFVGCANGTFRRSVNGGFLFRNASGTGTGGVSDIALSPSYADDNSILIGKTGQARLSTNGGSSFSRLGSSGPGTGATQVAFHSDYATNNMVYAGNASVNRWTVGTSSSWKSISGATMVVGLGVGADGTLYAASGDGFTVASGTGDSAVTAKGRHLQLG